MDVGRYGKVWLSRQLYSSGAAVLWWYACTGPERWRVLRAARRGCVLVPTLVSIMWPVLTDFFQDCDEGLQSVTALMASYITKAGRKPNQKCAHRRARWCWWHAKQHPNRRQNARIYEASVTWLLQLWSQNQPPPPPPPPTTSQQSQWMDVDKFNLSGMLCTLMIK